MNGVAIGPFVFASDRLAAILGIFAFVLVTSILARRVDRPIVPWSTWALAGGLITARLGHVGMHWQSFWGEPWRAIAFWQGGFEPIAGLVGVLLVSFVYIRTLKAGVAAAAALGLGTIVWMGTEQLTKASLGLPASAVILQQMSGPPLALRDFNGKPVVVNLWASWCPPCRREMPLLAEIAATRDDVTFVFINQGESVEVVRTYLAREKLGLDHVLLDQAMQVPRYYSTPGLPTTLFLRLDGTLASLHMGEISKEALGTGIARIAAHPDQASSALPSQVFNDFDDKYDASTGTMSVEVGSGS